LLAGEGFAPELYAVEDLVGGWKMVVMEYLSSWTMLHGKNHKERQKYKEGLQTAIDLIHDRSFMHGDIRGPNVLVSDDDKIKIIDFDDCGKNKTRWTTIRGNGTIHFVKRMLRKGTCCRRSYMFDQMFDKSQS